MVTVLACRGCCCGTSKHAEVDHDAQLDQLWATGVTVEVTPCLGPCRWSNVVVAVDDDGSQRWFGNVLATEDVDALCRWLRAPGDSPLPAHLLRDAPERDRARATQLVAHAAAAHGRRRAASSP